MDKEILEDSLVPRERVQCQLEGQVLNHLDQ